MVDDDGAIVDPDPTLRRVKLKAPGPPPDTENGPVAPAVYVVNTKMYVTPASKDTLIRKRNEPPLSSSDANILLLGIDGLKLV